MKTDVDRQRIFRLLRDFAKHMLSVVAKISAPMRICPVLKSPETLGHARRKDHFVGVRVARILCG